MTEIEIKTKVTASFLFDKLRTEGVMLLGEVRDAGGHHATRSLDAMSFGLWPSKGSHATGYEIKISRADWLKELSQIEKAEAFRPYCKYFYLVADNKVAELHEVPETWGFLEWNGRRLETRKQAPANTPLPFPPVMLSAIFKRCEDTAIAQANKFIKLEYENRNANLQKEVDKAVENALARNKDMVRVAMDFFRSIGIKEYGHYAVEDFVKANPQQLEMIKEIIHATKNDRWGQSLTRQAENLVQSLSRIVDQRDAAQAILDKIKEFEQAQSQESAN